MNVKLLINISIDKENNIALKDIETYLYKEFNSEEFNIKSETRFVNTEEFTKITKLNRYDNLKLDLSGYDYLMIVNVKISGENSEKVFINSSLFNTNKQKPYFTCEIIRGAKENESSYANLTEALKDLAKKWTSPDKIIKNKEIPVCCIIALEKNDIELPYNKKIQGKIENLLNIYGEDIKEYLGNKTSIAVKLKEPFYGKIETDMLQEGWNIITNIEESKFYYIPPVLANQKNDIKDIIETCPIWHNKIYKEKIMDDKTTITLRKNNSVGKQPSPTPVPTKKPDTNNNISKNLTINIGITHYGNMCNKEDKDYAEIIVLVNNKPLQGIKVEIFSFPPSEKPPVKDILKGVFTGGITMDKKDEGYYCAGNVPILGEFIPVTFYEGGAVVLTIKNNDEIVGLKTFYIPSFKIKEPSAKTIYLSDGKIKGLINKGDKIPVSYTWHNYKINENTKKIGFEIPSKSRTSNQVIFKGLTDNGKEITNILRVKGDYHGSTGITSEEGYWLYTISTISEVSYRVKPAGENLFKKWKLLKTVLPVNKFKNNKN